MESTTANTHYEESAERLRPVEQIVEFLSVAPAHDRIPHFRQWSRREWTRILQWLDDSGLAFYFLQRLNERGVTNSIPSWVCARLETNFALNRQRTEDLWRQFKTINSRFAAAGIPFVVVKGFSLPPQYCTSCALRYQGDLDYLIDEESLPAAQEILAALSYSRKNSRSRQEAIFLSPNATAPHIDGRQYSPQAPHAIELHFDIWDAGLFGLCRLPRLFRVEQACMQGLNEECFPALNDEDAFLLQILHTCHHLFTHWIRISSLLEIAYFLERRADDRALWSRIEQKIGSDYVVREFTVIVVEMAMKLFSCPVPDVVLSWSKGVRADTRLWVDQYSRQWTFSNIPVHRLSLFPDSKLVLFLQRQYMAREACDLEHTATAKQGRRPSQMLSAIRSKPALLLDRGWWRKQALIRRTVFHLLAGMRYACEVPRWHWRLRRMRASARLERETIPALRNSAEGESP